MESEQKSSNLGLAVEKDWNYTLLVGQKDYMYYSCKDILSKANKGSKLFIRDGVYFVIFHLDWTIVCSVGGNKNEETTEPVSITENI